VQALSALPLEQRTALLTKCLDDPSRAVRFAIAPLLAGTDTHSMTSLQKKQLEKLFSEYRAWLLTDSDRGTTLASLANFLLMQGDVAGAQAYFEKALQRDEKSLSVLLNYADYYRGLGNDAEAEKLLRKALVIYPDSADVHYALGLLLVREKHYAEAMAQLKAARTLAPRNSQYAYVYAVGLYSTGSVEPAIVALAQTHDQFPANTQVASALKAYCSEQEAAHATSRITTKACSALK
jgi:Tfp pilus assembly protein PilF